MIRVQIPILHKDKIFILTEIKLIQFEMNFYVLRLPLFNVGILILNTQLFHHFTTGGIINVVGSGEKGWVAVRKGRVS